MICWQNIDDVYKSSSIVISKGTIFKLFVEVDGEFEEFEKNIFGIKSILTHWSYSNRNKDISPFKLINYSRSKNSFSALLQSVHKSKDIDELKLLCQDITDVLNNENIFIRYWEVSI
ncbi:hypothetical protein L1N85_14030 [Paenibacillus alkaliterrae]|uniref:hypothetical protein n=1 Tax=Paenibacillus alkaliterrae TaxID=320909 RepID=UPI001F325EEF|nr:hypothetical protein [Paenibacillus alkaliterrae]MCF2939538.1 hypothetical protein [Paenibacillus alkaliterrae]